MATNSPAIADALPQLIAAEQKLSTAAAVRGITYRIAAYGGVRSQADTTKILAIRDIEYAAYVKAKQAKGETPIPINDWRRVAPFGNSYHNFGAAFDIEIVTKPAAMTNAQALAALGALAGSCGLKWGHAFGDDPHFELSGPIGTWKSAWEERGRTPGQQGVASVAVLGTLAVIALLLLGVMRK